MYLNFDTILFWILWSIENLFPVSQDGIWNIICRRLNKKKDKLPLKIEYRTFISSRSFPLYNGGEFVLYFLLHSFRIF